MSLSSFYNKVLQLVGEQLPAFHGPAPTLPTSGGKVTQCAVLWPTAGAPRYRANSTGPADRSDAFTVICVGATALDALAAADKVRAALTGTIIHPGDAPLRETGLGATPTAEPGTNPVRVSLPLQFTTISKEL